MKFQTKYVLSQIWMKICEKFRIFWTNLSFSHKKKKNMALLGNKFVNFDQKLNFLWNTVDFFHDRAKFLRGRWVTSELKKNGLKNFT